MSTTVLTSFASTYGVGVRHVNFNVRSSVPKVGTVEEGEAEWRVYRAGAVVYSQSRILDFHWPGIDGDIVYAKFRDRDGNSSTWVGYTYSVTGTANFVQYVDATLGNDVNNGLTVGTPVQTLAQAVTNCNTNQPTGVRAIYLKRGETWTVTSPIQVADNVNVRLTIWDTYSTGVRPLVQSNDVSLWAFGETEGFHIRGIEATCGVTVAGSSRVVSSVRSVAAQPWNLLVKDCYFHNAHILTYCGSNATTAANRNNGHCDFVSISDTTLEDFTAYAHFTTQIRYHGVIRSVFGADLDVVTDQINIWRCPRVQEFFYGDLTIDSEVGASMRFEVGPAESGSSADFFGHGSIADVTQHDAPLSFEYNQALSGPSWIEHVRCVRFRGNGGSLVFRHDVNVARVDFWDCQFRGSAIVIWPGNIGGTPTITKLVFRNCHFEGPTNAMRLQGAVARFADDCIELDSCTYIATNTNQQDRALISWESIGSSTDLQRILGYSNYNHLGHSGSVLAYFSILTDSPFFWPMSNWQTATAGAFDANSTSTASSTLNVVALGTIANRYVDGDAHMIAGTGPQAGRGRPRAFAPDAGGFLRSISAPDAGVFEYQATAVPEGQPHIASPYVDQFSGLIVAWTGGGVASLSVDGRVLIQHVPTSPVIVTAVTPAWDPILGRNGAVLGLDANSNAYGIDWRINPTGRRDDIPVVVPLNQVLLLCKSHATFAASYVPASGYTFGNSQESCIDYMLLVCVVPYDLASGAIYYGPAAIGIGPIADQLRSIPLTDANLLMSRLPNIIVVTAGALNTLSGGDPAIYDDLRDDLEVVFARFHGAIYSGPNDHRNTPSEQNPGYNPRLSSLVSQALLCLASNRFTDQKKLPLVRSLVQWGLDWANAYLNGRVSMAFADQIMGHKACIILAGYMLGIDALIRIGSLLGPPAPGSNQPTTFREDAAYFPVKWWFNADAETWNYGWRVDNSAINPVADGTMLSVAPEFWGSDSPHPDTWAANMINLYQQTIGTEIGTALFMGLASDHSGIDLRNAWGDAGMANVRQLMVGPNAPALAQLVAASVDIDWGKDQSYSPGIAGFQKAAWTDAGPA